MKWDWCEEFTLDRDREWDPHDWPHQPHKYHITHHFRQQFHDPKRFLTDEVVRRTITEGKLIDDGDGVAAFCWSRFGGVEFWLRAGYHVDGYRVAITAWPYLRYPRIARTSAYWSDEDLCTLEEFQKEKEDARERRQMPGYILKYRRENGIAQKN